MFFEEQQRLMDSNGMAMGMFESSDPPFIFRDEFSDNLAAGAVNGTKSTDGKATRNVTDTQNKISISGDELVLSGGNSSPEYGNPGILYNLQIKRSLYPVVFSTFKLPNLRYAENLFGIYSNPSNPSKVSPSSSGNFILFGSGEIKTRDDGGFSSVLDSYFANSVIDCAIYIKPTGGAKYYLRKTNSKLFTLIRETSTLTYSSLYFGITDYSGIVSCGKFCASSYSNVYKLFAGISYRNFFAIGDSKTAGSGDTQSSGGYKNRMDSYLKRWIQEPASLGIGGITVNGMKSRIDNDLSSAVGTPEVILINLGANDIFTGTTPNETDWKNDYLYIIDALHSKYPYAKIYLMQIWKRGCDTESNSLCQWISDIVAQRPSITFLGPDERVFLKSSDNGATYMTDDSHPNSAGYLLTATQWVAKISQ